MPPANNKTADYYDVLGVPRTAAEDDIKSAYRKLARKFHPDMNKGDPKAETRFKEVSEAYETLSDKQKRSAYDQRGRSPFGAGPGGPGGPGMGDPLGARFSSGNFTDISDLFSEFFGREGAPGKGAPPAGMGGAPDTELRVDIDLPLAATGGTTGIAFSIDRACPSCHGRGRRAAGSPKGKPQPCPDCAGSGQQSESRRLNVRIPAGVTEGSRVRVRGEGALGPDGRRGDLVMEIKVRAHPYFRRVGDDLEIDVPVTLDEALKGAKVTIPTLDGRVSVSVPPRSQTGTRLRLRGQGATRKGSTERGDLYAQLQVALPTEMSPEAEQHLEEFARLTQFDPRRDRWA